MTDSDRHESDTSLSSVRQYPGKFIPFEEVDKTVYEVIHPENSMAKLGMSVRTAYRKIDSGEIEYTLEKGSKRILVQRSLSPSDVSDMSVEHPSFRQTLSDNMSDSRSDKSETPDYFSSVIDDYREMLADRDLEIKELRKVLDTSRMEAQQQLENCRKEYQTALDHLREQLQKSNNENYHKIQQVRQEYQHIIDELRAQLEDAKILYARTDGQLGNIQRLLETQETAISSQKTTIEALNNERLVITQQLQKYRSPETEGTIEHASKESRFPAWMFWKH